MNGIRPVVYLIVLLTACASSGVQRQESLLLAALPAPALQTCTLATRPEKLPDANDLADVDAMRAALEASPNGRDGSVVMELMYDSTGRRERVHVLHTEYGRTVTQTLANQVRETAPYRGGGRSGWGVLLRVASAGGRSDVEVGRMEYCAPLLLNREEMSAEARRIVAGSMVGVRGRYQFLLDMSFDSTGAVTEKRLIEGSGIVQLDSTIMSLLSRIDMAPPLRNRRPASARAQLPLYFTFAADPRR